MEFASQTLAYFGTEMIDQYLNGGIYGCQTYAETGAICNLALAKMDAITKGLVAQV